MIEAVDIFRDVEQQALEAKVTFKGEDPVTRGNRLLAKLRQKDAFLFEGVKLRFSHNVWDLSSLSRKSNTRRLDKLVFPNSGAYVDLAKLYCLDCLTKTDNAVSTIKRALSDILQFLDAAEKAGYGIDTIPYSFYMEHYSAHSGVSRRTNERAKAHIQAFLVFYETHFSVVHDRRCLKLLAERDTERYKAEQKAGKTDEIERIYLEELLHVCHQVANDEQVELDERIVACCLLMYSQIGCRTDELGKFKVGAISMTEGGQRGKDIWHADFEFSKRKSGSRWEWTPSSCYMSEIALEAFRLLERLCSEPRKAAGTDALVVFDGGEIFEPDKLYRRYRKFILNHLSQPPFLNHPSRNKGMKTKTALEAVTNGCGWLRMKTEESIASSLKERDLQADDLLVYPEIRMFRNTVCTWLYRQKKSLNWIRRHLNHLHNDMSAYYNRPHREIDEAFSNDVYRSIVTTGARAVGPNGDVFMERVSAFLDKKGHLSKIEVDAEAAIEQLARKYPLKKKRGGMCIRCAAIVPCSKDDITDEIMCIFGVCPNHCSMYWMAPDTYAELKDAECVVRSNLERGHVKEAQHELLKMKRVLEARFAHEFSELDQMLNVLGKETVLGEHPELSEIIEGIDEARKDIEIWKNWEL